MKKITYIIVFALALFVGSMAVNAQPSNVEINSTVTTSTSEAILIAGKVVDSQGRRLNNVEISCVGDDGNVVTTLTNSYGLYILDSPQITAGNTYTVTATYKKLDFTPITVTTTSGSASYANFQTFSR